MAETREKIKEGIDDAATRVKHATEIAGEKGRGVLGEMKERMSDARDQGQEAIREGVSWSKTAVEQARDKASDVTNAAQTSSNTR